MKTPLRAAGFFRSVGLGLCLLQACPAPAEIRVAAIRGNTFDYVFMSVASAVEPRKLSFNDRQNRTHFVTVGGKLGEYTVFSFTPQLHRVFQPTLGDYLESAGGSVTLHGPAGEIRVLEMGVPLPMPGWRAALIDMDSAEVLHVGQYDTVVFAGFTLTVRDITANSVTAVIDGQESIIPMLNDVERAALEKNIRQRREQAALAAAAADLQREQDALARRLAELDQREARLRQMERQLEQHARRPHHVASAAAAGYSKLLVGYEYPCPSVYYMAADGSRRVVYWSPIYPWNRWSPWHHQPVRKRPAAMGGAVDYSTGNLRIKLHGVSIFP